MPVGIEAWVTQIPPVTRTWLALSVLTSLAVVRPPSRAPSSHPTNLSLPTSPNQQCQLVTPLQLYFSFKAAFTNVQVRAPRLPYTPSLTLAALASVHHVLLLRL